MTTEPRRPAGDSIHRLLDEAFAGIEPTPEIQDLKEEMRVNLAARAAELESSGVPAAEAARRAVGELGDIRALVDDMSPAQPARRNDPTEHLRNRVRPRPAFVVRTVLLSLLAFAGLVVIVLDALGVIASGFGLLGVAVAAIAAPLGFVTADALRQETTASFPLPTARAVAFGGAVALVLAGLGIGWLVVLGLDLPWLIAAAVAAVAGIALFAYLGATKTNRHKPWVLHHAADFEDGFSQDPASAARFGIYSAVLWTVTLALFIVLSFTIGWAWSWLALVGGFALMLVILARMLFPAKR